MGSNNICLDLEVELILFMQCIQYVIISGKTLEIIYYDSNYYYVLSCGSSMLLSWLQP